jgi:hypothetical protein
MGTKITIMDIWTGLQDVMSHRKEFAARMDEGLKVF